MQKHLSPLNQWAQSSPSLFALETPTRHYTWFELEQAVLSVAAGLALQGIKSGDVVTCVGKNSSESVILFLACLEIGAVCALTMPQTESELDVKLDTLYLSNQPKHIWFSDTKLDCYRAQALRYQQANPIDAIRAYDQDALASIVFTSGSTGVPKAVAHTSRQHLASATGLLARFRFSQGDTWLLSLPMYHVSGLAIVYRWLQSGATLKVGSGDLHIDVKGATHASLVATQLKRLLDRDSQLTLSHVLLGGSHIPQSLSLQAAERGIETWLGYGMTEAASTVTAKPVDGSYSAGYVLPKREVKLQDSRIFIGGETLASGYYYQGTLTPLLLDGWFDSKDIGQWQGDELKIIGRADNQFISGGENIHCEEIEWVLNQLEAVQQSIVVPVKDSEYGYRPIAVLHCDLLPEPADIETFLKPRLTKFKWPVAYFQMPTELLNGGIKVPRQRVKQWVEKEMAK